MLDIVIVNWNSGTFLKKCIESILDSDNESLVHTIFIIDNNSSDASKAIVSSHPKIHLIQNSGNLGFAKACNQGFKLCKAPYTLLLNPDARLLNGTISDCISFMESNREVDILGCQLFDDKGKVSPSCARFPTPLRILIDAIGLSKIAPALFKPAILMTDWNHLQSRYVDQVMGAFMLMHTRIFQKLGYFDERFFVYFEELDFSYRLAVTGGKSYYNADIKAIHTGMGTTESVKAFRLFLNLRSRLQYAKKHFSRTGYLVVYFSTIVIELITRFSFLVVTGKIRETGDLLNAYKMLLGTKSSQKNMPAT